MARKSKKAKRAVATKSARFSRRNLIIFILVFAIIGGVIIWRSLAATAYSVVLDQTNPMYGEYISFTETYPKAAAANYLKPRYPDNPKTGVTCYQNGVQVYLRYTSILAKTVVSNKDGTYTGQTGLIQLGQSGDVTTPWTSGAANCQVVFWYNDKSGAEIIIATNQFYVPG